VANGSPLLLVLKRWPKVAERALHHLASYLTRVMNIIGGNSLMAAIRA
jgi:hypothetical protein